MGCIAVVVLAAERLTFTYCVQKASSFSFDPYKVRRTLPVVTYAAVILNSSDIHKKIPDWFIFFA